MNQITFCYLLHGSFSMQLPSMLQKLKSQQVYFSHFLSDFEVTFNISNIHMACQEK